MQRVPELAGRELTLTALLGRDHEPQLPRRRVAGTAGPLRHPAGRQRHPPARDQPRGRARRDGRGGRRRRRAGGDRVHPARGLPRHAVHRGLAGHRTRRSTGRRRSAGSPTRSAGSTTARPIPGLFIPLRIVEAYRALAAARGVADPARVRARRRRSAGGSSSPAWRTRSSCGPATTTCSTRTSSTTATRIRIVDWEYAGMGDPFFDLGNFSVNHEPDAGRGRRCCWRAYDGRRSARSASPG